jgi:hypothetical protein
MSSATAILICLVVTSDTHVLLILWSYLEATLAAPENCCLTLTFNLILTQSYKTVFKVIHICYC